MNNYLGNRNIQFWKDLEPEDLIVTNISFRSDILRSAYLNEQKHQKFMLILNKKQDESLEVTTYETYVFGWDVRARLERKNVISRSSIFNSHWSQSEKKFVYIIDTSGNFCVYETYK